MANPVLVDVLRGGQVESRHRGSLAVVDAEGGLVFGLGDIEARVYPRSAVKALQALPLIESGAADKYGLSEAELALACASHGGEPLHAQTALAMVAKAGRSLDTFECGAHWPMTPHVARELAKSATPTALHNNCSGKHAGFICASCAMDEDPKGYIGAGHLVQREVRAAMEQMTGAELTPDFCGTDGCSIPTYGLPLKALALGFARFATGHTLAPRRAAATMRLRRAVAHHPFMVAGTGRFDTDVMQVLGERAFVKLGAEGVYCAALPEQGYGIAIKCDDGAERAGEMMMAAVLAKFLPLNTAEAAALEARLYPNLINWNGIEVGQIRAAGALAF